MSCVVDECFRDNGFSHRGGMDPYGVLETAAGGREKALPEILPDLLLREGEEEEEGENGVDEKVIG